MLALRDNLAECLSALRAHKLRASLTMLGLTMGVATLITVMTLVQGANVYVEQKIANLGTNVFQVARTPFAVTDFNVVIKALKYRKIELDDMQAIADRCTACAEVGASASSTVRVRYGNKEVTDVNLSGQTASMADIDTRTVERGRHHAIDSMLRGWSTEEVHDLARMISKLNLALFDSVTEQSAPGG